MQSPDGEYTLMAYGLVIEDAYYDIEKLAAQDTLIFPGPGPVTREDVNTVMKWVDQQDLKSPWTCEVLIVPEAADAQCTLLPEITVAVYVGVIIIEEPVP